MTNAASVRKKGPGIALFHEVKKHVKNIEIIAEDLGYMTQSVRDLVAETGYPGMKVRSLHLAVAVTMNICRTIIHRILLYIQELTIMRH